MATHADPLVNAVIALTAARDLRAVMAAVRRAARRITGAAGATFVLREGDLCHYADEDAVAPLWKGRRFPADSCISGWSMKNKRPAVVDDIFADPRIPVAVYRKTFVRSLIMVPIRPRDPVGAIGVYWAEPRRSAAREVKLVQALANATALALENVRVLGEARRWRALVQSAGAQVWTLDPRTGLGETRGVRRWWARVTGRRLTDFQRADAWLDDLHPEDRPGVRRSWLACLRAPVAFRSEYRVRASGGGFRHVRARAVALKRPDGSHELVGTMTDVTREREAERAVKAALAREREARSAAEAAGQGMAQVLERISDGFVSIDRRWRYTHVNKRAGELLGRRPEELVGRHVWSMFPEARNSTFHRAQLRALSTQRAVTEEAYLLPPWGRWFENRIFPSRSGLTIFFSEVTEKRRAQAAIEELHRAVEAERRRLQRLAECVPAGILMVEASSRTLLFSNQRATEILGTPRAEPRAGGVEQPSPLGLAEQVLATGSPILDREIEYAAPGRAKTLLVSAVPIEDERAMTQAVVASFHDVTEARRVRETLRQLSRRLLTAQDEERRRISRDLHDDLAQVLTAVKMSLESLTRGEAGPTLPSVKEAIEIVDRSIQQTRALSFQLHPPALDVLGLGPTLRSYLGDRLQAAGVRAEVSIDLRRPRFPVVVESTCFRVIQEAVTNVLRHARAHLVCVKLRDEPDELQVAIEDDGCGFDPSEMRARAASGESMGLSGMSERVALAEGTLEVRSQPGQGTRIGVCFPLKQAL
jgi:PAS domain S-box-containing protein